MHMYFCVVLIWWKHDVLVLRNEFVVLLKPL